MTPLQAIKEKCMDCCCQDSKEVKLCVCKECPLYNFRFGKNSQITRTRSEEQKAAASERFKKV